GHPRTPQACRLRPKSVAGGPAPPSRREDKTRFSLRSGEDGEDPQKLNMHSLEVPPKALSRPASRPMQLGQMWLSAHKKPRRTGSAGDAAELSRSGGRPGSREPAGRTPNISALTRTARVVDFSRHNREGQ